MIKKANMLGAALAAMPGLCFGQAAPDHAIPDHAADSVYDPAQMERARGLLRREHGAQPHGRFSVDRAEILPGSADTAYGWEAEAWFGGDWNKIVVQNEGEGAIDGKLESVETDVLLSRAIAPYFDLQAGYRFNATPGKSLSYAVVGLEGVAPYWFHISAQAAFSEHDSFIEAEAANEFRLTQRLVLQPRVDLNYAFGDASPLDRASGLNNVEAGLRLRYEVKRELAPYIGVVHREVIGGDADVARADGESTGETRFIVGLKAWF